jgi:uncharacterized membrane protein
MSRDNLNDKNMASDVSIGKRAARGTVKFFVGLLMLIILIAITVLVLGMAVFEFIESDIDTPVALGVGIGLSVVYAIVVFAIPYLRKMSIVKWWAILALLDAAWWAYLLITN